MNRTIKLLCVIVFFTVTASLSSCEQCKTCEKVGSDNTREFCEEELDLAEESDNWDC